MGRSHRNALDRTLVVVCRCLGAAAVLVCLAALTPLPNYLARSLQAEARLGPADAIVVLGGGIERSEEHTSELQAHRDLVCRLLLRKTSAGGARADRATEGDGTALPGVERH